VNFNVCIAGIGINHVFCSNDVGTILLNDYHFLKFKFLNRSETYINSYQSPFRGLELQELYQSKSITGIVFM
jgi:hypothetical protein